MTAEDNVGVTPTFGAYSRMLRRRYRSFLLVALLVPAIALLVSVVKKPTYSASAEVLLEGQDLADKLATRVQGAYVDPLREIQTEEQLASVLAVARNATAAVPDLGLTPTEFQKISNVTANFGSNLLTFSAESPDPGNARRLATAYARAFVTYRRDLDRSTIRRAQRRVDARIALLEGQGDTRTALYRSLLDTQRGLTSLEALYSPRAVVVHRPGRAVQVAPQTTRNVLLGVALGLLLAVGTVLLFEGLDSRPRSPEEIGRRLGLRLLGRLPAPPSELQAENRLAMLAAPLSLDAEAFRTLRAGLDLANAELGARVVLVTSALDREGKSTTVANLAVALARAGRHVVVADFDLRNPSLHRFFGLSRQPGVVDVALGDVPFRQALQAVSVTEEPSRRNGRHTGRATGRLEILPTGQALKDPDLLGGESRLGDVLQNLRDRADLVLVDSAPLLPIGDTIALSSRVDALVLVARLDSLRSSVLADLRDVLSSISAPKLGYVVTGVDLESAYSRYRYPTPERMRRLSSLTTRPRPALDEASAAVESGVTHTIATRSVPSGGSGSVPP